LLSVRTPSACLQVYRGSWNGTTVAVKVMETTEALDEASVGLAPGACSLPRLQSPCLPCASLLCPALPCPPDGCHQAWQWAGTARCLLTSPPPLLTPVCAGKSGIFEAVLSSNLSHPNIVHTYQYAFRPVTVGHAGGGAERGNGAC
jgi:hypothetical protein